MTQNILTAKLRLFTEEIHGFVNHMEGRVTLQVFSSFMRQTNFFLFNSFINI